MKSPYPNGNEPYQEARPDRIIFDEEERLITTVYKFLGWQPTPETVPEYLHCLEAAHNYNSAFPNAWKSAQHAADHSDITKWCTKCKIYWKLDLLAYVA